MAKDSIGQQIVFVCHPCCPSVCFSPAPSVHLFSSLSFLSQHTLLYTSWLSDQTVYVPVSLARWLSFPSAISVFLTHCPYLLIRPLVVQHVGCLIIRLDSSCSRRHKVRWYPCPLYTNTNTDTYNLLKILIHQFSSLGGVYIYRNIIYWLYSYII